MTRQKEFIDTLSLRECGRAKPSQVQTRPSYFRERFSSCGFAVVALENPAEFALATNTAFGLWDEGGIQDSVVSTDAAMGSLLMIMIDPHAKDIVKLPATETDEVI